jgi:hypothetical protein
MPNINSRTEILTIRCSTAQKEAVKQLSIERGVTVSKLLHDLLFQGGLINVEDEDNL